MLIPLDSRTSVMVSTSPLEVVLSAVTYGAALLATLRAGSRATYLLRHGGQMGVVDGPLILGPDDVLRRRQQLRDEQAVDSDGRFGEVGNGRQSQDLGLAVSPLWESTYGFNQAVRLAQHMGDGRRGADERGRGRGRGNRTGSNNRSVLENWEGGEVTCSIVDRKADLSQEGVISRLFTGKEGNLPYSLSLKGDQSGHRDQGAKGWKLDFDWEQGTFSWADSGQIAVAPVPKLGRRVLAMALSRLGIGNDVDLDFDLVLSSTAKVPPTQLNENDGADDMPGVSSSRLAHISVYAPETFARLRKMFGVSESSYHRSMMKLYVSFQSNSKGAARVGGFFFFTRDGAYMVKTVKKEEAKTFSKMLPKYYKYMSRNYRRSLLTRFCGMYSVRITDEESGANKGQEHVFIVMNAVFPAESSKFISERFDLKGSTVGRECSLKEREERGSMAVLKDLDLAREVSVEASRQSVAESGASTYGINIGRRANASLLDQLRRDVALLEECKVMDYSLLVGVVKAGPEHAQLPFGLLNIRKDGIFDRIVSSRVAKKTHFLLDKVLWWILPNSMPYYGAGVCGVNGGVLSIQTGRRAGDRAVYYMGIIDFLQPWTTKKVMEREVKGLLGYNTKAISCVSPKDYAARFLDFIDAHVT